MIRSPTKAAVAALVIATLAVGSLAPASAGAGSQQLGEQNAGNTDGEASEDAEAVPWPAVASVLAPLIATAALTRRRAG